MAASELQQLIDRLLRQYFEEEFTKVVEEDLRPRPGWQGFTGIHGLFDDVEVFVLSWTPREFDRMWDSLTHESKVSYIKNLISR